MSRRSGGKGRNSKRARDDDPMEDLDLDVPAMKRSMYEDQDEALVHNHRAENEIDSDADLDVLPQDAHDTSAKKDGKKQPKKKRSQKVLERDEDRGIAAVEEDAELADRTNAKIKKGLRNDDFDVLEIGAVSTPAPRKKPSAHNVSTFDDVAATTKSYDESRVVIEQVERDFKQMTSHDRLEMIKAESPEVEKLLSELEQSLKEVKSIATPLRQRLFTQTKKIRTIGGIDEKPLLKFLETKVQLLLSYCIHILFYLLLKVEGQKVKGHAVVDRLVEIRTYLEKLWPVEQRLQYSISKLLSGDAVDKPAVSKLRPVNDDDDGVFRANKAGGGVSDHRARRHAEKAARVQAEIEREEMNSMVRLRAKPGQSKKDLTDVMGALKPLGQEEAVDAGRHFLVDATEGFDDDDEDDQQQGMSLIDKLRSRKAAKDEARPAFQQPPKTKKAVQADPEEEDGEDMDDLDEDEGDLDYDALLAEEDEREAEREEAEQSRFEENAAGEAALRQKNPDRRQITQRIQNHRGLTKARPKDKKTPRVAKKQKAKRGEANAKAQSRTVHTEADHVNRLIKTHVTHSTGLA